ncbi:alpha-tocopherol transfer protein-like isoform X1 [Uloborus diversus]|uniref:alpha-tocopherol transfer protein-like isoform X1 n=1 Tax=Uloborus diversus TaxID=327109 RepID=UPI002409BED7|nr:alpha-tocopherol transfer protein-like isoform X1 [Uloborus diversus]XP_054714918.1 alpha-tocopherol transfer protein-like isoform X1 [Uloborus diversus]XP_054714919.1 alpha-tocopherol transfer protein-like isoform X1 [Uloborus diversus]
MMSEGHPYANEEFLPFDFAIITNEIRERAALELNETNENRSKCLKELKKLIQRKKNFKGDTRDEFLVRFLRARKFRTKDAFALLCNYYEHRVRYPDVYQNYNAKSCTDAMQANMCNFLPTRAPDGSSIWVIRVGAWDPEIFPFEECLKLGLLCQEKSLQNQVTQICGLISIVDLKGLSWSHVRHLHLQNIRCLISSIQESFPLRHKAIHVINNPAFFALVFAILSPLLKHKIKNRIFFHGDNLETLHQILPPSILPEELGGSNGPFGNEKFFSSLLQSEDEFQEQLKYGYSTKNTAPVK